MSNYEIKTGRVWKFAGIPALTAGLLSIVYWYRRPIAPETNPDSGLEPSVEPIFGAGEEEAQLYHCLLDQFLPEAEFSGEVAVEINADASTIYAALNRVTLNDMPIAKWLGNLRYLPSTLTGKARPDSVSMSKPFLQTIQTEGGNIILAEAPNREIVFGAIGKFHDLRDQQIFPLHNADEFERFAQPDCQKMAISLRLLPLIDESGYRLKLIHRTHALSLEAHWKFALYWIAIKPGGNFVSWLMLRAIKSIAEKATSSVALQDHHSS
jgi:hypothetical protein